MLVAKSTVTAQGQISIPAEVLKTLGIGPGSMLEWYEENGEVMVRRAGGFSCAAIHRALFPNGIKSTVAPNAKSGVRKYMRKRHTDS